MKWSVLGSDKQLLSDCFVGLHCNASVISCCISNFYLKKGVSWCLMLWFLFALCCLVTLTPAVVWHYVAEWNNHVFFPDLDHLWGPLGLRPMRMGWWLSCFSLVLPSSTYGVRGAPILHTRMHIHTQEVLLKQTCLTKQPSMDFTKITKIYSWNLQTSLNRRHPVNDHRSARMWLAILKNGFWPINVWEK